MGTKMTKIKESSKVSTKEESVDFDDLMDRLEEEGVLVLNIETE